MSIHNYNKWLETHIYLHTNENNPFRNINFTLLLFIGNNHFFFGLCKPSCFIPRFGNLLVPVVVDFDAYCSSRISKLSLISSGFKPFFLFCAGSILDSEDFRGSCSLSSGVKLSESVWKKKVKWSTVCE